MEGLDNVEELIKVVRQYPVLYDRNHKHYAKVKYKESIWNKIAQRLNFQKGSTIKEQWRKLRDCHRDALRRQRKKQIESGFVSKTWAYQHQLDFLLPYMSRQLTARDSEQKEGLNMENVFLNDVNLQEIDHTSSSEYANTSLPMIKGEPFTQELLSLRETSAITSDDSTLGVSSQRINETQMDSYQALDDRNQGVLSENNSALYQFFMSMFNTTKNLPKHAQLKVRRKIFEAVTQAEEVVLESQFPDHSYTNLPSTTTVNIQQTHTNL